MRFAPTASEEAEKINAQAGPNRYGMSLVTDQGFWEKQGIKTGEDLALSLLGDAYSDMHKSLYGRRPNRSQFSSVEEAETELELLDKEYESKVAQEELDAEQQRDYEKKEAELSALMPGQYDYEQYSMRTGMGRRTESRITVSRDSIRNIIKEVLK